MTSLPITSFYAAFFGLLLFALGGLALAGRVAHAMGISREPENLKLRQLGMALTFTVLGLAPLLLLSRIALG